MATGTTNRNKSILSGLLDNPSPSEAPDRGSPPTQRLTTRVSGLARVTSGDIKEKTLKLVDPASCRMWERHNRRYDLLNEQNCGELLEALRSQGEQEFPAIVRRLHGDPAFEYEVICGARRHWSVSYLRNVEHRDIKYLIEERELNDEQAFRLADVENRPRTDISDYERALDYLSAIDEYYGGVAQRMAERMDRTKAWLSRFLDLGRLPAEVVDAFGDVRLLKEKHARDLKPLLADSKSGPSVIAEARRLAEIQSDHIRANQPVIDPAKVVSALKSAATDPKPKPKAPATPTSIDSQSGAKLFTLQKKGGKLVLELVLGAKATNAEFEAAFQAQLAQFRPAPAGAPSAGKV